MANLPVVSIVGRPNVGKSSLFNRILGRRAAVVSDRDGVTRDRHYQVAEWQSRRFTLVDTGGFLPDDTIDQLADSVRQQIFSAVQDSDLVLFMVDIRVGVTSLDQQFARLILKTGKPVILVANKGEKEIDRTEGWSFLQLGLGQPRMVSALTGYACLSLLDEMLMNLPEEGKGNSTHLVRPIRFAILGRPNAGKSTLLNRMMGEERAVVSDIPGTTRDSIDCEFAWDNTTFVVTDTAGLRKKAKVSDEVEVFSNMRTLESIRRSDLTVMVLDATRGLEVQDFRIMQDIRKAGKGLVIAINKWDILDNKDSKSFDRIIKEIVERDPLLEYVPIISICAKDGLRVHRLLQEIRTVYGNCRRVLGRDRVTQVFDDALMRSPHPTHNGRVIKLDRACQILVEPPVICIETPTPESVDEPYKRYLLKRFFEEFHLHGAPLRLNFDRKLHLRKDEELEQFIDPSAGLSSGIDSDSRLGSKGLEEN